MTVLKASELHAETGRILDAATQQPQYVMRDGVLLVIQLASRAEVTVRPEGYFADAYGDPERERRELAAFAAAPAFTSER